MKTQLPKLLWVSIVALGIMMLMNLTAGVAHRSGVIFMVGLIDAVLIWGILKGFRWTFWAAAVLVFGGLIYIVLVGDVMSIVLSLIFDALLFVPMVICRDWFLFRSHGQA